MARNQSKSQVRNLYQYKGLSEDEFEKMWEERESSIGTSKDFEERIQKKLDEFSLDYDLDDLKINDREALKSLVRALLTLEDYENLMYEVRAQETVSQANINVIDRIHKLMSDLRKDISKLQEDLNITRRSRKSDKESSVITYLQDLKDKARRFHESRTSYVFCPKCNMLLGNVWTLYPDEDNKFTFKCKRELDDGSFCGEKFTVTSKELLANRGTNKPEVTPEGML